MNNHLTGLIAATLAFVATSAFACTEDGIAMVSDIADAPLAKITVGTPPLAAPFSIRISICTDQSVSDVTVDAMMPAHQHGMNYSTEVMHLQDADYVVEGLVFHMPGTWEITLDVRIDNKPTSYRHQLAL